jgi:hypothetical protein
MASDAANGILKIKNVTGSDYAIEELDGHILADQAELDLLDTALPTFYGVFRDAERSAYECPAGQLCQDIEAGNIEVTLKQNPVRRR